MTTARFNVLFVAIFYSLALLGNSGDIDFEKLKFNLPQKSVTQEIKGSAFVFSFSEKGDGGQFYLSAKGGRDHSQGLLATSLSYSEKEEIIIQKEDALAEKDIRIADLGFELDKLRRHIFGFKSEKRIHHTGDNQMGLFELGVTQSVQEELSCSVASAGISPTG